MSPPFGHTLSSLHWLVANFPQVRRLSGGVGVSAPSRAHHARVVFGTGAGILLRCLSLRAVSFVGRPCGPLLHHVLELCLVEKQQDAHVSTERLFKATKKRSNTTSKRLPPNPTERLCLCTVAGSATGNSSTAAPTERRIGERWKSRHNHEPPSRTNAPTTAQTA